MERSSVAAATMRAHWLIEPGKLELREVPRPVAASGEMVIRVRTALTCGTDVKAFARGHPKWPMPTLFGHEFCGEVAEVGAGVRGFREGDPVVAAPTAPCNHCYYCQRQQENLCATAMETMVLGAYADYVKLPAHVVRTNVYAKPAELSFAVGALLEPLACVLHGLEFVRMRPDDTIVLVGAGPISLLHLLALRHRGFERIVLLARSERRAELARRAGAEEVLIAAVEEARAEIGRRTHGRGADVVIECTGQVEVWEAAPALVRPGGQLVLFGGCRPGTRARFDTQRLHYDQVQIVSPFHFTPRAVRSAYEMLAAGDLGAEALISGAFSLPELAEALSRHQQGDGLKFAVVP